MQAAYTISLSKVIGMLELTLRPGIPWASGPAPRACHRTATIEVTAASVLGLFERLLNSAVAVACLADGDRAAARGGDASTTERWSIVIAGDRDESAHGNGRRRVALRKWRGGRRLVAESTIAVSAMCRRYSGCDGADDTRARRDRATGDSEQAEDLMPTSLSKMREWIEVYLCRTADILECLAGMAVRR